MGVCLRLELKGWEFGGGLVWVWGLSCCNSSNFQGCSVIKLCVAAAKNSM